MDTAEFLARTVAPGNFFAVAFKPKDRPGMAHRFFPAGEFSSAAGFIRWADGKGFDVYHAQASFIAATPEGTSANGAQKFTGSRTGANVQSIRSFWIDLDVLRPGETGKIGYPDQVVALTWLKQFLGATKLPRPNQVVSSGFGLHIYWILEDALTKEAWIPYAEALHGLVQRNGFTGIPFTTDVVRLLRPPGTSNHKGAAPAPVTLLGKLTSGEIPNAIMLGALQPHVGLVTHNRQAAGVGQGASALAGGTVTPILAAVAQNAPNMNAAAQANIPTSRRPRSFARIATQCKQIEKSLAEGGANDKRPIWYLGNLTAAYFCEDGAQFAHPISSGWSNGTEHYTPAVVDAAVAQIAKENASKSNGFPSCRFFDRERSGVCQTCPHYGKVNSPLDLGLPDGDLPEGYRRNAGGVQKFVKTKEDGGYWMPLVRGDFYGPILEELANGYAVTCTYDFAGKTWAVRISNTDLPTDPGAARRYFSAQYVTVERLAAQELGDFFVSWMTKLREQRVEREDTIQPFGWATVNGELTGFAVGGTFYRKDGGDEEVPALDRVLVRHHKPVGTLDNWRKAADFLMANRLDLQVIVAASFGAPLMRLAAQPGLIISPWSSGSGVGKTSAAKVAQTVWSQAVVMNSLDDTNNSVFDKAAKLRSLPIIYDEMRAVGGNTDMADKVTGIVFALVQGKEKARLNRDLTQRQVGDWHTLMVVCANRPMFDQLLANQDANEAGIMRLLEFNIDRPPAQQNSHASSMIDLVSSNYGHAGRVFAAYIAANIDRVKQAMLVVEARIQADLKTEAPERFHVAGIASMLLGAQIANKLGLTTFDLAGLRSFLYDVVESSRVRRRSVVMIAGNGGIDLEGALASFMAAKLGRKLVTDRFLGPGRNTKPLQELWQPQDRMHVEIHISRDDAMMRIDRAAFYRWCREHQLPGTEIVERMKVSWRAQVGRRSLAGGTGWAGGQMPCIELDLHHPVLAEYLPLAPRKNQAAGGSSNPHTH